MPTFLSVHDVEIMHHLQINRYGGLPGLRDRKLLESAVFAPQATFEGKYLCKTILIMGATYAYGIIKNHPFLDANKRTGIVSALLFFKLNNVELFFKHNQLYELGINIAMSKISIQEIEFFFKKHIIGPKDQ